MTLTSDEASNLRHILTARTQTVWSRTYTRCKDCSLMNKGRKSGEKQREKGGGGRRERIAHSSCDATSCPLWWSRFVKWATNHQLPITELEEKQDHHTKELELPINTSHLLSFMTSMTSFRRAARRISSSDPCSCAYRLEQFYIGEEGEGEAEKGGREKGRGKEGKMGG